MESRMGQPSVRNGVKCTYFVLRKDSLLDNSRQCVDAKSLPPPPSASEQSPARTGSVRPRTPTSVKPLSRNSNQTANDRTIGVAKTCKHLISKSWDDSGSNCEFCRGERLVEEAARNNDLLAAEELNLEQLGFAEGDFGYQGNRNLSCTTVKPFKKLWRTLSSAAGPSTTDPLVLASVKFGKISSRLIVYVPECDE